MLHPQSLPKQVMQKLRLCIPPFNFQHSLVSLMLSSSFIRLRHHLSFTFILPSILRSITHKKGFPTPDANNPVSATSFIVRKIRGIPFLLWLCIILLHFSHYRSNWSSPSFSSTTFQNFRGIFFFSLSEVSSFQHQRKLCSESGTLLVPSVSSSPVCWCKDSSFCWKSFFLYMIYLLTAIGLTPDGSNTVHIYTQTVHRTTQSTQKNI